MCLASPYITEAVTVADSLVIYCPPVWACALHDILMSCYVETQKPDAKESSAPL